MPKDDRQGARRVVGPPNGQSGFKLGQEAEKSWRRIRGFDHLAKVITGIRLKDRIEVKDDIQQCSMAAA
jgi:hypothetical protein